MIISTYPSPTNERISIRIDDNERPVWEIFQIFVQNLGNSLISYWIHWKILTFIT